MTPQEAISRYGIIVNGVWDNEGKWCSVLRIPDDIAARWVNSSTGKPTNKIYCNIDIQGPLLQALFNLSRKNLLGGLKTYDGCFYIRDIRGCTGRVSAHSYGIAIDINAEENELGTHGNLSKDFIVCFTDCGFKWGGAFDREDPMHFTMGW